MKKKVDQTGADYLKKISELEIKKADLELTVDKLNQEIKNLKVTTETRNEAFWLMDPSAGSVIYVNNAFEDLFGITNVEFFESYENRYKNIFEEDLNNLKSKFQSSSHDGTQEVQYRVQKCNEIIWLKEKCFPILEGESITKIAFVAEDITQSKHKEDGIIQFTDSLEEILSKTSAGIIIINKEFELLFRNRAIEEIVGLEEDREDRSILDYIDKEDISKILHRAKERFSGKKVKSRYSIRLVKEDGTSVWVDLRASLINYKNDNCILCTLIDITPIKLAEDELENSKKNFKAILDNTLYSFFLLSRDLTVVEFNSSAAIYLQESFNSELDHSDHILNYVHDDQRESFIEDCKKVLKGEKLYFEKEVKLDDGNTIWLESQLMPAFDEKGHIFGITYSIFNISESKKMMKDLREQQAYLNALVESPSDLIVFSLDKNFNYLAFNSQHRSTMKYIWGVDIQVGMNMLDCITNDTDRKKAEKNFNRALKGDEFNIVEEYGDSNHDRRFYEDTYSPMKLQSGEIIGICVYVRDITDKIRTQLNLEESKNELEEMNASKDKLFSIVAHDLKAPIFGFMGLSEMLMENLRDMTISDVRELSNHMFNSAKSIWGLLENLLEWSRAITGKVTYQPDFMNLHLMTDSIFALYAPNARDKNIELINNVEKDMYAWGDPNMITTVIRNLVNNAIKFTEDGKIEVYTEKKDDYLQVSIKDSGVGIPRDLQKRLFQVAGNLSKHGTKQEAGTGLGLLICKEFIEKNGGKIWVESELGKGSEFKFTVKLKNPQ